MPWTEVASPPEPGVSVIVYLPQSDVIVTATYVCKKWMSRGEQVFPSHWQDLPQRPQ